MKAKRILALLLMLALALCALPLSAFAAYEAPKTSDVKEKLTDANEGIVWDTSFELANGQTAEKIEEWEFDTRKYVADEFAGTYNIGTGNAGMVDTNGKNSAYQNFFYDSEEGSIVFKATGVSAQKSVQINPTPDPTMTSLVASFDIEMKTEAISRELDFHVSTKNPSATNAYLYITEGRKIRVKDITKGDNGIIGELPVGETTNLTVHIKPDKETLKVTFDVYVDGVLAAENVAFATATNTSFTLDYYRFFFADSPVLAATIDPESGDPVALPADGQEIYRLHALRVYYSDECYETVHGTEPCNFNTYKNVGTSGHKVACACGKTTGDVIAHFDNGYAKCDCEAAITDVSVSIDSDLAINYYADIADKSLLADGALPSLKVGGETVTDYKMKDGKYVFTYDGIGPHQVGNKVDAVLYIGDVAVAAKTAFSVEDYCTAALELYADDTALVGIISDLLAYAAEADKYRYEKTESDIVSGPAPSGATPTAKDDAIAGSVFGTDNLYVYSAGVYFDYVNRLYFKIYSETGSFVAEIDGTAYTYESLGENLYIVYSAPISPMDFDTVKVLTVKESADTAAAASVNYSVNTYAYNMKGDAKMGALATALYAYGKSCEKLAPVIIYNTNEGTLPEGAPTEYDATNGTALPTPTRDGYEFGGWYTNEALTGSKVTEVPAGTKRAFEVYAKWLTVLAKQDYTNATAVKVEGTTDSKAEIVDGINYNSAKAGLVLETKSDADENTYMSVSHNGVRGQGMVTVNTGEVTINEGAVSFEFKVKKIAGVDLSYLRITMQFGSGEIAFTSGTNTSATYTKEHSSADNGIKFNGTSTVFATINESDYTTIRLTYNMNTGKAVSYDGNGAEIASYTFAKASGVLKNVKISIYNLNTADSTGVIENSAVAIDDIKVVDGNIYG